MKNRESGIQPMVYHSFIIPLVLHRPDLYTICILIMNFLMRATAFCSTGHQLCILCQGGLSLRLQAPAVRSPLLMASVQQTEMTGRGGQLKLIRMKSMYFSLAAEHPLIVLGRKRAQGCKFRFRGSSNWRFLWFWTSTSRGFNFSASLTMLPLGPEGPSPPVTP